jgi:PAS domain S-box-containing protein
MNKASYRWLLRYGSALAAVGVSLLLRLGLTAWVGPGLPTYITFYPAIMAVALLGGLGPGLLATTATALATDYWILAPHGFGIDRLVDTVGLAFFCGMGLFMSIIAELYRRTRLKAAAYDQEQALRESERQFRTLADSIPNLAWWANGDGYITWYNRRWYGYTGTTPQQMEGWGWQSVHDPRTLPAVLERWKVSIDTGQPFDMTFPLRGADGVCRPFLTRVMPLKDAQGRVQQWFGTNTDVSEQKRAEETEQRLNNELRQRVAELQAAGDAVQASRRAALNLMDDAVQARQQAEQASADLRSAAEQRRLALEAADLGAWDYHFQTGEVFWDERCREMWGLPQAEQIDYARAIAAIHPEDRAGVDEAVKQALAGKSGGAYHREFRVVWPDGSEHWIASHGRVYFQGEGDQRRAVRFIGANHDITERKQREEELQRLNRTLRAHAKSDQALMRAQTEAEYLEAACRIVVEDCGHAMVWVGFAEEDEGKTVRPAAQAGFEEGYLETLRITWADTERGRGPTGTAIRTGQPNTCRNMLTDPRFEPWRSEAIKRGYASSLVLPLLAEGRAFGALTIYSRQPDGFGADEVTLLTDLAGDMAHGITALRLRAAKARADEALRESEARLAGLVGSAMDAILSVDAEQRIVLFNAAAEKTFGCPATAALGQPLDRFIPESLRTRHRQHVQEFGSTGVSSRMMSRLGDLTALRADGQVFPIEASISRADVRGQQIFTVILRDVTDRKLAQAALQQTADDLKRSNRDLEQFAYVASHDLQEPLRAVGGYVKLLQHRFPEKLDAKARGYVAGAFEGATRMERLITDLLAYSRVGTHGGNFASTDLQAVLERALDNLAPAITAAKATITHDPLPALSVDATQIMQLFQNLIGNALKFHGESPPGIHVGAQRGQGRWVFSVRDNGIGIEPQYYERIFQIFQRLHTRKDYPGTGIGLAICKRIVERHGGTIWVESQPGQSSTFFFAIPESSGKRESAT